MLILRGELLWDGVAEEPIEDGYVVIENRTIMEVGSGKGPSGETIKRPGTTIMPGLIDAHVHVGAVDVYFDTQHHKYSQSLVAFMMADRLRHFLRRGYTTIRDCGGTDYGFREAIERGLIEGPRLLVCDRMISQTGGHGDMRTRADTGCRCEHHEFGMTFEIADGVSAVRRAVREQVRRGADFVKVMASGGAASHTDKLECVQYSKEELRIAAEEASMGGVYLAAHAIPSIAISHAAKAGARTIEHANFLDDASAADVIAAGSFIIPTVATYVMASRNPEKYDYTPEMTEKVRLAAEGALQALEVGARLGVRMGGGSDLLGEEISWLNRELELKSEVLGPVETLRCSTSINAEAIGLGGETGVLAPGLLADVIAVRGNPLINVSILGELSNIPLVVRSGGIAVNEQ